MITPKGHLWPKMAKASSLCSVHTLSDVPGLNPELSPQAQSLGQVF
jgi:hypothetical protein